jgi:hypothetical protein
LRPGRAAGRLRIEDVNLGRVGRRRASQSLEWRLAIGPIVIGHSRHGRLHEIIRGSIVQKLLRLAGNADVHVVAVCDKTAAR